MHGFHDTVDAFEPVAGEPPAALVDDELEELVPP